MKQPVWIKLLGLPIEMWLDKILQDIRNFLGKIIEID
jgi:hypothetical protein